MLKNILVFMVILLMSSPIYAINFETTTYSGDVSQAQVADIQTTNYTGLSSHIQPIFDTNMTVADSINPALSINAPTEDQNISTTDRIDFNATYTELHPDTCILGFNNINYSMAMDTTNHECTVTIGNIADGSYSYYVWMNDTTNNHNQTDTGTVSITYTASWYERNSGGGGGVIPTPRPIIIIIDENLTIITPSEITESIALDTEIVDAFSLTNIANTTTGYTLRFDCSGYMENKRLCPFVSFNDAVYELNGSDIIYVSIDDISREYIQYSVDMPKGMPLTTYHADIIITSDKNETLVLPIEYHARKMLTMSEFIGKYGVALIIAALVGIGLYLLAKRRKKRMV